MGIFGNKPKSETDQALNPGMGEEAAIDAVCRCRKCWGSSGRRDHACR